MGFRSAGLALPSLIPNLCIEAQHVLENNIPKAMSRARSEWNERYLKDAEANIRASFELTYNVCESPIEQVMLAALCCTYVKDIGSFPTYVITPRDREWPRSGIVIVPQFAIGPFRLDFLVVGWGKKQPTRLALECDGAEFHSGAAAIERDAQRDSYMAGLGIATHRFKGADIWLDPLSFAASVERTLAEKIQ